MVKLISSRPVVDAGRIYMERTFQAGQAHIVEGLLSIHGQFLIGLV